MKSEELKNIVFEELSRVLDQKQGQLELSKLDEAKLRKGDIIKMDDGEYGVVNKIKGKVAYIKLPSMPGSFHPIEADRTTYKGKHKGRDLYLESLNEAPKVAQQKRMEFGVEYRDSKGKPKKDTPLIKRFKTKALADKFAKKGNQIDKVGGKYTVVSVQVEENVAPDHDGKAAPYGSGYDKVKDLDESTKAYEDSLKKIAADKQLKMLSKKDKETLIKIAKLLQKEGKLEEVIAEGGFDPYVIMNKSGIITNRATKLQAIGFARKKTGVYAIPDKPKVLKTAQKLIKKMSGAKLKDAMFDLRFEGLTEAKEYKAGDTIKLKTGETVKINQVVKGPRPQFNTYRAKVKGKQVDFGSTDIKEGKLTEKLARGLKPLLKLGSAITKKVGEDKLLKLSDAFEKLDDERGDDTASDLNMAIEKMQDGYASQATGWLKKFNKECKKALKEGKLNEAEVYKYKKFASKAFKEINDAMFNFRHSMGIKTLTNKDMKLKKKVDSLHQAIFSLQKEMKKDGLTEGKLNEMDINDPILVAIRARKTDLKKKAALPKVKKISTKQYYKLMDKEIDLIDQMKDAAKEYERLDSEMNQDAGQKGSNWTDADANRYGGDLNKLQTKVEKLAKLKLAVKKQIMDYRVN